MRTTLGRAVAFNDVLEGVARHRGSQVTLVDVGRMLDPSGQYQSVVDGITTRTTDGIHISVPGGEWLQPQILPTVVQLGRRARAGAATVAAAAAATAGAVAVAEGPRRSG